jgi:hypothetical protein
VFNGMREETTGHYYRIGHRGRRWEFPRRTNKNGSVPASAREEAS